jgi:tetratricopeptide (TPR) repeat protein
MKFTPRFNLLYFALGLAYAALGEPRKAIEFYEQRLTIRREIGDIAGEGTALGNLGNAYADLGEPRRALEYAERANEQVAKLRKKIAGER